MKKSKLTLKTILIIVSVLAVGLIGIFALLSLPWLLIAGGIWLSPDPPKPEITYGEFPFEITYAINEEVYSVDGVYVCEYAGIGANEGVGKYVDWDGYIKDTEDEDLFIMEKDGKKIYCSVGWPEYYMDDPEDDTDSAPEPLFYSKFPYLGGTSTHYINAEELADYGIMVISYELSKPIKNSFK